MNSTDGCGSGSGSSVSGQTLERLLCNARIQTQIEDDAGDVVRLGRMTREPPAWMLRQVRYRDRGCRFPGCGARAFTEAHHVRWWRHGGRTTLDNLLLICSFHLRLVHELEWFVRRGPDGSVRWFHPDGTRYWAGPTSVEARPGGKLEAEPVGQDRQPLLGRGDRPPLASFRAFDPELVLDHHPPLVVHA